MLERGTDEEPGRAAARQAGLEHARALEWDAVLMLDADSVIEPGFFAACERALAGGADAVQARSESSHGRTLAQEASLAAFTLQGITIPRGRDRLGLSVRLRGTGMAIRREVALAHRFRAPASEDLVLHARPAARRRPLPSRRLARLRSEGASDWGTFGGQKVRYEAGRMAAARTYVPAPAPRAFRHRDAACLEAAWFLATPPFALGAALAAAGAALAALARAWMRRGGVRRWRCSRSRCARHRSDPGSRRSCGPGWRCSAAPWYLVWKAVVQLRALASVLRRDDYYPPTARTPGLEPEPAERG